MKKLLLGLGTVSLAILPVAAMASCSSAITDELLNIKLLSNMTTVTQADINKNAIDIVAVQALPSTTPEEKKIINDQLIIILKNIFIGVNENNINNFEVLVEGETDKTITLQGKIIDNTKYVFNVSSDTVDVKLTTIVSPTPTNVLPIALVPNVTQAIIDKSITDYKKAENELEMAAALSPLFSGITEEHLKTIDGKNVLLIDVNTTITLIASPTYYFTNVSDTVLMAKVS